MELPHFLVIGEQKCGTGWIRDRLNEHPLVYVAPKELNFFNRKTEYERGLAAYSRHFANTTKPLLGEKSPEYFWENSALSHYNQNIFDLINQSLPQARIILVLRSPIERAISALGHHTQHRGRRIDPRLVRNQTVSEILLGGETDFSHLGIVKRGFYAQRYAHAREVFGDRLLLLVFEEDVISNPERGLDRICHHIGAEQYSGFRYKENTKNKKASYAATILSYHLEFARPVIRVLDRGAPFRPKVGRNCKKRLWEIYRQDIAEFEQLIGREIPDWKPND